MAGSKRLRSHTPMSESDAEGALGPLEQPDSEIVLLSVCQDRRGLEPAANSALVWRRKMARLWQGRILNILNA